MTDPRLLRFYLGKGKANATKQAILAKACGWYTPKGDPDTRRVQKACESLRAEGLIIASSCREPFGSYIAVSEEEIGEYKGQLFARVKALVATARAIDKGWEAEIADELFGPCRNCGAMISKELHYCNAACRQEWHARAREVGYSLLEGAA